MTTKRTPLNRGTHRRITPEVIEAFCTMEATRLTDDDAWWAAHSVLHSALGLPPWEWPGFDHPDDRCPYPEGCHAALGWQAKRDANPHRLELYHELAAAAREAGRGAAKSSGATKANRQGRTRRFFRPV